MKMRRATSRRKWRNRFYRLQRAAAIQLVTDELLASPMGDAWARATVNTELDVWLSLYSVGEVGEREIEVSQESLGMSGPSLWHTNQRAYRASVMAKRPYWIKHIRAEAKA